jgi:hypothetical protein
VVPGGWQHLVLALPEGAAGTTLREIVVQALPNAPITAINSGEDIALCYEAAHLPLREMAAALVGGDAIPAELVQQVMARSDVKWFSLAPAAT